MKSPIENIIRQMAKDKKKIEQHVQKGGRLSELREFTFDKPRKLSTV
jgi:hypothetical protein